MKLKAKYRMLRSIRDNIATNIVTWLFFSVVILFFPILEATLAGFIGGLN